MTITLESFNGHDIQSDTYASWLEVPDVPYGREADLRTVQPLGRWGRFVRHEEVARTVVVHLEVKSSFITNGEILSRWFKPGTEGELVVDFDGTDRILDCVVRRIVPYDGSPNRFTAVLLAPDPRWRAASKTEDVEAVTATGQTWEVTNVGNATEDAPVFRVQPTDLKAASDDWRYVREVIVVNRVDRPLSDYAVELTEEWDHAAEVTASRSLNTGNDVRVLVDGVEVPRWDGGGTDSAWNKTKTKIWINLSLSPGLTCELLSTITDASPATNGSLSVVRNSHQEFPDEGYLLLGDEVIRYTGKSATSFTGITRGARGTTAAAATAGDTIYWVERRVQVMYGYTGAGAPESRDERKPMIDLDASTNTEHVWNDFAHDTDPRSMQWGRSRVSRDDEAPRILAPGGEPASSMVFEYQADGPEVGKPAFNTWSRSFPTGTIAAGGEPTYQSKASATASSTTSVTINKPSGLVVGDLLFAMLVYDDAETPGTFTVPDGWTDVDAGGTGGGSWIRFQVLAKSADADDVVASNFTFGWASSASLRGHLLRISGVSGPSDIGLGTDETNSSTTNHTINGVTTEAANELLLYIAGTSTGSVSWTPPSGFTEIDDAGDTNRWHSLGVKSQPTAGATGNFTVVSSASTNANTMLYRFKRTAVAEVTRAVAPGLALQMYVRDEDGNESLLETVSGYEASATVSIPGPDGPAYSIAFYGRSQLACATPTGPLSTASASGEQQFTAPFTGEIEGVWTTDSTTAITLYTDDGSDAKGVAISGSTSGVSVGSDGWYEHKFTNPIPVVQGEKYWIVKGAGNWTRTAGVYAGGVSSVAGYVFKMRVLSVEGFEDGALGQGVDEEQITLDDVTVYLDSDHVPYVSFGTQADAYWLDGTLTNNQTGQSVTLALLCSVDDEIEIDVDARTVRNITTDESVLYGATFSDEDRWIELEGGDAGQANELQYHETGLVGVTVDTDFRSRWQ